MNPLALPISGNIPRRQLILFGGVALGSAAIWPSTAYACGPSVDQYFTAAISERDLSGQWAISVAPRVVHELSARIDTVSASLEEALKSQTTEAVSSLIDLTNFLASGVIFALGVTGLATAAPLYIAGIALAGGVILAKISVAPASAISQTFLIERSVTQMGGLLGVRGDDVIALTNNAKNFSSVASNTLAGLGALIAFWNLGQSTSQFLRRMDKVAELREQLAALKSTLYSLQRPNVAQEFRYGCMAALVEDLAAVQNQCLSVRKL